MRAITRDILEDLLATCVDSLRGTRDKALLLVGFTSGGRRRSELVNINISDLHKIPEGYLLTIRRTKNDQLGHGHTVPIIGAAASALMAWQVQSGIRKGKLLQGVRGKASLTRMLLTWIKNLLNLFSS